jgi:hypothetical protein
MPEYQPIATLPRTLHPMIRAYLECAEWSGIDDEQREAFENSLADWSPESIARATQDCMAFLGSAGADADDIDAEQMGHDFWLTRNRHGAGFWDRGLGELGNRLTDLAHGYGEMSVWFDAETSTLHLEG